MPKKRKPFAGSKSAMRWQKIYDRDAEYRAKTRQEPTPTRRQRPDPVRSVASPVTITRPDGDTRTQPAHSEAALRRIAPERLRITRSMRHYVSDRDQGACRYCGNETGPFEIDHVVPVALGGRTIRSNLVLACQPCNSRKGANVWRPKPIKPRPT